MITCYVFTRCIKNDDFAQQMRIQNMAGGNTIMTKIENTRVSINILIC